MVTDKLNEYFPKIMDVAFTRYMEEQLDKIEEQHLDWLGVLREFYGPFKETIETAQKEMKHARTEAEPSEYKCPKCGKMMLYRRGRYGRFLGCSDYPNCKGILKLDRDGNILPAKTAPQSTGIKCYKCKDGELVIRRSKKGPFLGCNRFPKCRTIINYDQLDKLKQLQSQGNWPPETIEEVEQILGKKQTKRTKKQVEPQNNVVAD